MLGFQNYTKPATPVRADYQPPPRPTTRRYYDDITMEMKWIAVSGAKRFFGLMDEHLEFLWSRIGRPIVPQFTMTPSANRPLYWLFQVFDFCRVHKSQNAAEHGMFMYEAKNQRITEDIQAEMGLGADECYGPWNED